MKNKEIKTIIAIVMLLLPLWKGMGQEQPPGIPPQPKIEAVIPFMPVYYHMFLGQLKAPRGIFYDSYKDEIYCADTGNNLIGIFNKEGVELFSFGGAAFLSEPYDIMVDSKGQIYVIDIEIGKVKIFNYRGEWNKYFDFSSVPEPEVRPVSMNVDRAGHLYFLDSSVPRVLIFSENGQYLRSFGKKGVVDGRLSSPTDIALDKEGNIYITDRVSTPVQVFSPEGRFLRGWGEHDIGDMNFSFPSGIAIDSKGRVFVSDTLRQDIKIFDSSGNFLMNFGGFGFGPGQVAYPTDVTIDGDGRAWVTEKVGSRIQIYLIKDSTE